MNRKSGINNSGEIHTQYIEHERARTLFIGRLASAIAITGIILFLMQDIYILGLYEFIPWRILGIIPPILFLLFSFTLFRKYPSLIIPMYAIALACLVAMVCGLTAIIFMTGSDNNSHLYPITTAMILIIFAVFIFSAGAIRFLPAIILIPVIMMCAYLFLTGSIPLKNWAILSNPGFIAVLVSVYSVYQSQLNFREFSSRKQAEFNERLISIQHNSMSTMLNAIDESAFLMKPDGTIVYANETLASRFGIPACSIEGMNAIELLPENIKQSRRETALKLVETKKSVRFIDERLGRSIDNIVYPVPDDRGEVIYLAILGIDITERIARENEIQRLLDEKKLLLKEVHHRIKNNMLTIAGLLTLRAEAAATKESSSILNEMSVRVTAMMRIYDRLYRSEDYSHIELHDYIKDLLGEIRLTVLRDNSITIIPHIDVMRVRQNNVFSIGIIINELVTNSLKYAFPAGRTGVINVSVKSIPDNRIIIMVSDNGIGLPGKDLSELKTGFGLDLVSIMVQQCKGTMEISAAGGTAFTIIIPNV